MNFKDLLVDTYKRSVTLRQLIKPPFVLTKEIMREALQMTVTDEMMNLCREIHKKGVS